MQPILAIVLSYFLFDGVIQLTQKFELQGDEALHLLQSRRIRKGEIVQLQDQSDRRYDCRVLDLDRRALLLEPFEEVSVPEEPKWPIHLYQALVKEKALDFILQKATELGVSKIVLFESERSQRLPKGKEEEKKLERWKRILQEAAKQSGRSCAPLLELCPNPDFDALDGDSIVFLIESESRSLAKFTPSAPPLNLIVGPEGGFASQEQFGNAQAHSLGSFVLRADTAAIASLAICRHLLGELD